jgi:hypothetical protein
MQFEFFENQYIASFDYGIVPNMHVDVELLDIGEHLREQVTLIPHPKFFSGKFSLVNYYSHNDPIYQHYIQWDRILDKILTDHLTGLVDNLLESMETHIHKAKKRAYYNSLNTVPE